VSSQRKVSDYYDMTIDNIMFESEPVCMKQMDLFLYSLPAGSRLWLAVSTFCFDFCSCNKAKKCLGKASVMYCIFLSYMISLSFSLVGL
jgi:hypothetical protein